jgi:hypothetical protein
MMMILMMMCVSNFWGIAKDIFALKKKSKGTGRCCASAAEEDRLASNMTSNMN